jgi:hypothetical protein
MGQRQSTAVLEGEGAFAVQPGCPDRNLVKILGRPHLRVPDAVVEGLPGVSGRRWRRAVYFVQIPVNVPVGNGGVLTHISLNLRFQYRTDTKTVWGVGVTDVTGTFRKSLGALSALTDLKQATELLGEPDAVEKYPPPMILQKCIWVARDLVYVCEFFREPHRESVRTYRAGDLCGFEVFARRQAPKGYTARVLAEAEPGDTQDPAT